MSTGVVAAERTIHADAQEIFDLLADPSKHPLIDGSGSVRASRADNPARLTLGSTFAVDMRIGLPYKITNTVVELEEGRRIAWRHFGGHRWRYVLTPVEGGTLVREEWDPSRLPALSRRLMGLAGFPARNRAGIEQTLLRIEELLSRT